MCTHAHTGWRQLWKVTLCQPALHYVDIAMRFAQTSNSMNRCGTWRQHLVNQLSTQHSRTQISETRMTASVLKQDQTEHSTRPCSWQCFTQTLIWFPQTGVEGGIVSASAAGRQLQAILDQLSGGHGNAASHVSSAHTAGQHSDKLPRTARAKHKQLPQRGSLFPCLCVCVCVCSSAVFSPVYDQISCHSKIWSLGCPH